MNKYERFHSKTSLKAAKEKMKVLWITFNLAPNLLNFYKIQFILL